MRRLWPCLVTVLALPACGIQPTGVLDAGAPARASWDAPTVYYVLDGVPYPAMRPEASRAGPEELLKLLAAGPTAEEQAAGLVTEVPRDLRISVDEGILVIDDPGSLSATGIEQIVCTMQGYAGTDLVDTDLFGPDGTVVDGSVCPVR